MGCLNGQGGPASSTKLQMELLLRVGNTMRTNGKAGVSGGGGFFLYLSLRDTRCVSELSKSKEGKY